MSGQAPIGRFGRSRFATPPPRPRRTPPRARCPAQAAATGPGAAGRAPRPASAAQTSPASYGEGADCAGQGAAWLAGWVRWRRGRQRRDIARPHCRTHAHPGDQGGSRASCRDRFVTLRLISAIQESGKLFPCRDGEIRTSLFGAGPNGVAGNDLSGAPWVYVAEPVAAAAGWRIGTRWRADLDEIGRYSRRKGRGQTVFITRLSHCYAARTGRSVCSVAAGQFRSTRGR